MKKYVLFLKYHEKSYNILQFLSRFKIDKKTKTDKRKAAGKGWTYGPPERHGGRNGRSKKKKIPT